MKTTSRTRSADGSPANAILPNGAVEFRASRAFLVFVLTPVLILFMSRKAVDHVPTSAGTKPQTFEQWPAGAPAFMRGVSGFVLANPASKSIGRFSAAERSRATSVGFSRGLYGGISQSAETAPLSPNLIYARAMFLAGRYDSRPYWKYPKLEVGVPATRATADLAIEHLIPCESMGQPINRIDTNGKMSYGILQFQDWDEWEQISGITGNPDNRDDAIRMAEWAIENGMINHWTCASILKIM